MCGGVTGDTKVKLKLKCQSSTEIGQRIKCVCTKIIWWK